MRTARRVDNKTHQTHTTWKRQYHANVSTRKHGIWRHWKWLPLVLFLRILAMWNESRNESITGTDRIPYKSHQPWTSLSIQGHVPQAPSTTGYPGWMEIQTAISLTCLPHADTRVYAIHEIHQYIYIICIYIYIHKCGSRRYGCNWKTGVLRKAEVWVSCSNFVGRTWAIRNRVVLPNAARGSWFVTGLFG